MESLRIERNRKSNLRVSSRFRGQNAGAVLGMEHTGSSEEISREMGDRNSKIRKSMNQCLRSVSMTGYLRKLVEETVSAEGKVKHPL